MMSHRSRPARVAMAAAALTLAAPSTSFAANTVFGGSTTGGDPIALTADKKAAKLKSAVIAWVAPCDDGMRFPVSLNVKAVEPEPGFEPEPRDLAVTRNAKGRFAGTQTGTRDLGEQVAIVSTTLAGKLRRGKGSGTLSADVAGFDKATGEARFSCSVRVRWSATSSPGRVYAGMTNQEEPVVVRLDAARRRASEFLVGWRTETCDPPDRFMRIGEQLVDFPVKAKRFGDVFEYTVDGDAGSRFTLAYDLAGKLTSRGARGTLRVRITERDAAGATMVTCDTGGVTWKAATSGKGAARRKASPVRRGIRAAAAARSRPDRWYRPGRWSALG